MPRDPRQRRGRADPPHGPAPPHRGSGGAARGGRDGRLVAGAGADRDAVRAALRMACGAPRTRARCRTVRGLALVRRRAREALPGRPLHPPASRRPRRCALDGEPVVVPARGGQSAAHRRARLRSLRRAGTADPRLAARRSCAAPSRGASTARRSCACPVPLADFGRLLVDERCSGGCASSTDCRQSACCTSRTRSSSRLPTRTSPGCSTSSAPRRPRRRGARLPACSSSAARARWTELPAAERDALTEACAPGMERLGRSETSPSRAPTARAPKRGLPPGPRWQRRAERRVARRRRPAPPRVPGALRRRLHASRPGAPRPESTRAVDRRESAGGVRPPARGLGARTAQATAGSASCGSPARSRSSSSRARRTSIAGG